MSLLLLCVWGFLHPPPALRLRSLMAISVLLGPKQAAQKLPFKLQKDHERTGTPAIFRGLTDHRTNAALTKPLAMAWQRSHAQPQTHMRLQLINTSSIIR